MYTKRAEFKAGVVVLLGLVALLALLYFAGGSEPIWGDYRYVQVRFEQSFTSPKVGDAAYMNGVGIGRVSAVEQKEELRGDGGTKPLTREDRRRLEITEDAIGSVREVYVLATVKMPISQRLPRGTTAQIAKSLTGIRTLAFLPGIQREHLTDEMTVDNPIPGREAPGIGDLTQKVNQLVERVDGLVGGGIEVMAEAKALLKTAREKVDVIDTEELGREAKEAVASLRRSMETVEKRIDGIAKNLEEASSSMKDMAKTGAGAMEDIAGDLRAFVADARRVVARLDEIIKDAKGPAREILSNLRLASADVREATKGIVGLGPDARRVVNELGLDLQNVAKNLNDTAHNLLDASEDLRTHPWKLLNKPDPGDIGYANLRNASQSYMRAMRDVNEASQRLFALLQRPDGQSAETRPLLEKARAALQASLGRYGSSEQRFLALFREANAR